VTAGEVLLGILVAAAAGIACALAVHLSETLRRSVQPLLIASQTIPIPIVAPLLVAWLGFGLAPKLAIVGLICFFPITVTTLDGLASVDPELRKLMRTLDATRWQTLRHVEAPAALPALLSGARIAVAIAVIGAVLAEQAGSSEGLGHLILQAIPQLETARAYAAVVVLSLFAVCLYGMLSLAERRLLPWTHRTRGGRTP
jgi:NitT/TauT family transport system permease protein/putative hydroxymethylpyrimidine transport system permease protein